LSRLLALSSNSAWNLLNFRRGLLLALIERGYSIAALVPSGDGVAELEQLGVIVRPIELSPRGVSPVSDLRLLWSYWRSLGELKPAAFLGFTAKPNIYGSIAAHRRGVPVIANITGLGTGFLSGPILEMVLSRLYRTALEHAQRVFFHNGDDRDLFFSRGLVGRCNCQVIPGSGVNLSHFGLEPPTGNADSHFLFIGRFLKDKGIVEFVEAAQTVKQHQQGARFTALGTVEPHPKSIGSDTLEKWKREQLVEFLGSADDVRPFIAQADCVVLPSYREGLPRALLEASAMARAVIGSDVPGCRDVVEDGITGYLCAPRSASSLAGAMIKFADLSPDRRAAMGLAGRRKAEREFGEQRVVDAYISALEQILANNPRGSGVA
jgi:glycosyltransferase involved in cell wall biosynthesis